MEDNASSTRFVKLFVRVTKNPIWTQLSPAVFKVFAAFLLRANYQDAKWYDGKVQHSIPRGSFITSYASMAEFCNLSVQQVRDAFDHLENLGFATYRRTHRHTLVTVSKYNVYQYKRQTENTVENTPENRQRTQSEHSENTVGTLDIERIEEIEKQNNGVLFPVSLDDPPFNTLDEEIASTAKRMRSRQRVRNAPQEKVENLLRRIIKPIPKADKISTLHYVEEQHLIMAKSVDWNKEGRRYWKGLGPWLNPDEHLWENGPVEGVWESDEDDDPEARNREVHERERRVMEEFNRRLDAMEGPKQ